MPHINVTILPQVEKERLPKDRIQMQVSVTITALTHEQSAALHAALDKEIIEPGKEAMALNRHYSFSGLTLTASFSSPEHAQTATLAAVEVLNLPDATRQAQTAFAQAQPLVAAGRAVG